MKKVFIIHLVLFLFLSSIAIGESVTRINYELELDNEIRIGKYTGEIDNGLPNGFGIFETTNPNGFSWHYIGTWLNGLMHGDGAIYWEDGSLEIGSYENGHFVFGYYCYEGANLSLYNADTNRTFTEENENNEDTSPTTPIIQYIGNKNSHVFHRPDCKSVQTMKEKNKMEFYSREDAISMDYKPCSICNP